MAYWLDVFTVKSLREFQEAGSAVSGFPEFRWKAVQRIKPGDILICYLRGQSCWVGALEVVSEGFRGETRIWEDAIYPCRVKVKPIVMLEPDGGIPAKDMLPKLELFANLRNTKWWGVTLRISPRRLTEEDGVLIMNELNRVRGVTPVPEKARKKAQQSYHDQIRDMLYEIGLMEQRVSEREYRIDGERIDVAWKRIEAGNPYAVFEVQIGGNFYEALAKLKHAWDKWNSRPFLVTTEQYKERALEWISGSFHEIEAEMKIVDCNKIKELYEAIKKAKDIKAELGIG